MRLPCRFTATQWHNFNDDCKREKGREATHALTPPPFASSRHLAGRLRHWRRPCDGVHLVGEGLRARERALTDGQQGVGARRPACVESHSQYTSSAEALALAALFFSSIPHAHALSREPTRR